MIGGIPPENLRVISRIGVGAVYLAAGAWILLRDRGRVRRLFRDGFRASYAELAAADEAATT